MPDEFTLEDSTNDERFTIPSLNNPQVMQAQKQRAIADQEGLSAESEARAFERSVDQNLPIPVVRKTSDRVDLDAMHATNPNLVKLMGFNPSLAKIGEANSDYLSGLDLAWHQILENEKRVAEEANAPGFFGNLSQSYEFGQENIIERGSLAFNKYIMQTLPKGQDAYDDRLDFLRSKYSTYKEPYTPGSDPLKYALTSAAEVLPMWGDIANRGYKYGAGTAASAMLLAAAAGNAGPQALLPEEVFSIPISGTTGFISGTFAGGGAESSFVTEAGLLADELASVRDQSGNPLPPEVVRAFAVGGGAINAGLEFGGLYKLASLVPGVRDLRQSAKAKFTRSLINKALNDPRVLRQLTKLGLNYGKVSSLEGLMEGAQEAVSILTTASAQSYSEAVEGQTFDEGPGFSENAARVVDAAQKGFFASIGLGAPGVSIQSAAVLGKAVQAQEAYEAQQALAELAQSDGLINKSPAAVAKLLEQSGDLSFMLPSTVASGLSQNVAIAADLNAAGITSEVIQDAVETGIDIPVSVIAMQTQMSKAGIDVILPHLKASPTAMTASETSALDLTRAVADGIESQSELVSREKEIQFELDRIFGPVDEAFGVDSTAHRQSLRSQAQYLNRHDKANGRAGIDLLKRISVKRVMDQSQPAQKEPDGIPIKNNQLDTSSTEFKNWFGKSEIKSGDDAPLVMFLAETAVDGVSDADTDTTAGEPTPNAAGIYTTEPQGNGAAPSYIRAEKTKWVDNSEDFNSSESLDTAREEGFDAVGVRSDNGDVLALIPLSPAQVKPVNELRVWSSEAPQLAQQLARMLPETGPEDVTSLEETVVALFSFTNTFRSLVGLPPVQPEEGNIATQLESLRISLDTVFGGKPTVDENGVESVTTNTENFANSLAKMIPAEVFQQYRSLIGDSVRFALENGATLPVQNFTTIQITPNGTYFGDRKTVGYTGQIMQMSSERVAPDADTNEPASIVIDTQGYGPSIEFDEALNDAQDRGLNVIVIDRNDGSAEHVSGQKGVEVLAYRNTHWAELSQTDLIEEMRQYPDLYNAWRNGGGNLTVIETLKNHYAARGKRLEVIDGVLYTSRGFTASSLSDLGGLTEANITDQITVGIKEEIAEAALDDSDADIVIMADNPNRNIYSDSVGATVSSENMGGFDAGLKIYKDDSGAWHFEPTKKNVSNKTKKKYKLVEDYLKSRNEADQIFASLQKRAVTADTRSVQQTSGPQVTTNDVTTRSLQGLSERGNVTVQLQRKTFFQSEFGQGERGQIEVVDDNYLISIFDSADLSTMLHESAHAFFLEFSSLIEANALTEEAKSDYAKLLDWLGAEPGQELTTEQHEKFARGTELYLREGKAPNAELRPVFERFKRWLTNIYKSVSRLNVELNDDVRAVFDRIWTAEEQVDHSLIQHEMSPLTERQSEDLKLTAEQKRVVNELYAIAVEKAKTKLMRIRNRQISKLKKKWRNEAEGIVAEEPFYVARQMIIEAGGLNYEDLRTKYGSKDIQAVRKRNAKFVSKRNETGTLLETIAEQNGMTWDELLVGLMDNPSKNQRINEIVNERVAQHDFGFNPLEAITDTVEFAEAMEQVGVYLETIVRGQETPDQRAALETIARLKMQNMPVSAATRVDRFMGAMSSSLRAERKAISRGAFEEALMANRQARIHWEMARLARKLRDQNQKDITRINKAVVARAGTIQENHHNNLILLAARFNMLRRRPKVGNIEDLSKDPLESLLEAQGKENKYLNVGAFFSPFIVDEQFRRDYRELTVQDYEELVRALDFLDNRGRAINKDKSFLNDQTFKEKQNELIGQAETVPPKKLWGANGSIFRKMQERYSDFIESSNRPLYIIRALDGFTQLETGDAGAFERLLWNPLADAWSKRQELSRKLYPRIQAASKVLGKRKNIALTDINVPVPDYFKEHGLEWTVDRAISVALNMGNAYNREAVMAGYGLTNSDLQQLTSFLTSQEWDAIQEIWDTLNLLWDEQVKQFRTINHYTPKRVEADPFAVTLPDGTTKVIAGGYFPVKFDPRMKLDNDAKWDGEMDVDNAYQGLFGYRVGVKAGHLQSRIGTGGAPVLLDTTIIGQALDSGLQYASYASAIQEAAKLLNNPRVKKVIRDRLGQDVNQILNGWLHNQANPNANQYNKSDWFFNWLRRGASATILGANISVALKQPFSIFGFANDISPFLKSNAQAYLRATKFVAMHPLDARQQMMQLSPAMASRSNQWDREITSAAKFKLRGAGQDIIKRVEQVVWAPINLMDNAIVVPAWWTAYYVGLEKFNDNVQDAVRYADTTISASQPFNRTMDTTYFQNQKGFYYLFTMFSSFMSIFGSRADYQNKARKYGKISNARYAWMVFMERIIPSIAMGTMFTMLNGIDEDDDEQIESSLKNGAIDLLAYQFIGRPIVRDVAGIIANFAKTGQRRDFTTPAFLGLEYTTRAGSNVYSWMEDLENDAKRERALWAIADMGSFAAKVPASQVTRRLIEGQRQIAEENANLFNLLVPDANKRK